jgi:NADH-quinone oxidoreductase subunit N
MVFSKFIPLGSDVAALAATGDPGMKALFRAVVHSPHYTGLRETMIENVDSVAEITSYIAWFPEIYCVSCILFLTVIGVLSWPLPGADPATRGTSFERLSNSRLPSESGGGSSTSTSHPPVLPTSPSGLLPSAIPGSDSTSGSGSESSVRRKDDRDLSGLAVRDDLALSSPWSGSLVKRRLMNASGNFARMCWLSIVLLVGTLSLVVTNDFPYMSDNFVVDDFGNLLKVVVLLSAIATLLLALPATGKGRSGQRAVSQRMPLSYELVLLILCAVVGLLFLVSSYNLLSVYLSIELQSLSLYVLAATRRGSEYSTEAGLKYFVLGALSSGFLLLGSAFVYGFAGTTSFDQLHCLLQSPDYFVDPELYYVGALQENNLFSLSAAEEAGLAVGFLLFICGLLFKLAAVPFHMWAPDVYEGAPAFVTAFFAIVPKVAIMGVLCRIFYVVFPHQYTVVAPSDSEVSTSELSMSELMDKISIPSVVEETGSLMSSFLFVDMVQPLLIFTGVASIVVGCVAGLQQTKLKRLIAYSAIGHAGYLLLGLVPGTALGAEAVFFYLLIYVITSVCVFAVVLSMSSFILSSTANSNATSNSNAMETSMSSMSSMSLMPTHYSNVEGGKKLQGWKKAVRNSGGFATGYGDYLTELRSMRETSPGLALAMVCAVISLAGVPPFAGFFSKLYVFHVLMSEGLFLLSVVGVLASVVSCFYYLRVVKLVVFPVQGGPDRKHPFPISAEHASILSVCTFFLTFFMIYPAPLLLFAHNIVLSICS